MFSVAALTGVLQRASQRKRYIKEEKPEIARAATPEKKLSGLQLVQTQHIVQAEGQQEMSRSNSQMSMATSQQFPQQQSSTTVISK